MKTLLLLLAAHALCDYPLQGDFLSRGKNLNNPIPGVPWYQCMLAHSLIHAGAVCLVTGSVYLGLVEFVLHFFIDCMKCEGDLSFNTDQLFHYLLKFLYAFLIANG